jgi:hypothetical protein
VIRPRTQLATYWGSDFTLTDTDIEQIYNHFLEVERPQTVADIARDIMAHRVAQEINNVKKQMQGRHIYQPQASYQSGDELVFPGLHFASGTVTAVRDGYNPEDGAFKVIAVELNGKLREFAAALTTEHELNTTDGNALDELMSVDVSALYAQYGQAVRVKLIEQLRSRPEFVKLGDVWFVKALMAEVNIGHLHLAEAVLDMYGGGPLPTAEILPHLDMDSGISQEVQLFSLNYALLQDARFDNVAPRDEVAWFLRRLEPAAIQSVPERIVYKSIPYDRALLSPQLLMLERELDDEWSELAEPPQPHPVVFTLLFPHRYAGVIPMTAHIRPLFPPNYSPRQRVVLVDDEDGEEIEAWVMQDARYIFGLTDWYNKHEIPIGGFVHLAPGPQVGVVQLGYDRRRPQREWVRLATAVDNRIQFELRRRSIGCGFDDLMVVGTDVVAAIDALWRRAESHQRSLASLLAEIFPPLAALNPQSTVHAKTLYSAINMLRRVTPGALFAELMRHPAFQQVGDHYWQFDRHRWQDS